jgi:hypothetical protein
MRTGSGVVLLISRVKDPSPFRLEWHHVDDDPTAGEGRFSGRIVRMLREIRIYSTERPSANGLGKMTEISPMYSPGERASNRFWIDRGQIDVHENAEFFDHGIVVAVGRKSAADNASPSSADRRTGRPFSAPVLFAESSDRSSRPFFPFGVGKNSAAYNGKTQSAVAATPVLKPEQ